MKTNETLQRDVQDAIKWEPLLNAAEIGVTVKDGVVTLTGTVDSYPKKIEAEAAAGRVAGVRAVIECISVQGGIPSKKDDAEIANQLLKAFKWNWKIPENDVKVLVENGWVTLEGVFNWNYQKEAATRLVNELEGVTGVTNNITIKAAINDEIEKESIDSALKNNWATRDRDINVSVSGKTVTLKGTVNSWHQKVVAERIGWNTPGVTLVENELLIRAEDNDYAF